MGYDMHWVRKPEGEAEAVALADAEFYRLVAIRDGPPREECGQFTAEERQAMSKSGDIDALPVNATPRYRAAAEAVHRAYEATRKAERSYFRLNISGMVRYREVMDELKILRTDYDQSGQPDWPDPPEDYWTWDDDPSKVTNPGQIAAFEQIKAQYDDCRSWSPEGPVSGIPIHKLCSNDAWLVTPEECFYAAEMARSYEPEKVMKLLRAHNFTDEGQVACWMDWCQWLADASEHGGFTVH